MRKASGPMGRPRRTPPDFLEGALQHKECQMAARIPAGPARPRPGYYRHDLDRRDPGQTGPGRDAPYRMCDTTRVALLYVGRCTRCVPWIMRAHAARSTLPLRVADSRMANG
jgi:hypothetical protein